MTTTKVSPSQEIACLKRGGDILAEILGRTLVWLKEGEPGDEARDAAYNAILEWHLLKANLKD